jgi:hypothetical protein
VSVTSTTTTRVIQGHTRFPGAPIEGGANSGGDRHVIVVA